jgi:hypothetical protein
MPRLDFRPAIQEPVYLVLSRQQVESGDTHEPMTFLQHIIANPDHALEFMGRVSLIVDGYNDDARELFEVPEVRRYIKALDDEWPFWFYFLSQTDESLKVLAMCLCSSFEVAPGQTHLDPDDFARFWERGVDAVGFLFHTYKYPLSEGEVLLMQIARFFDNGKNDAKLDDQFGRLL